MKPQVINIHIQEHNSRTSFLGNNIDHPLFFPLSLSFLHPRDSTGLFEVGTSQLMSHTRYHPGCNAFSPFEFLLAFNEQSVAEGRTMAPLDVIAGAAKTGVKICTE